MAVEKQASKKKISMTKVKAEYVAGEISLRALSEKYNIPLGKLFRHSTKEGWQEARKEFRSKVSAEAIASAQTRAIKDTGEALLMAQTLLGEIRLALGDPKQLYRRIVADKDGKLVERDDFTKIDANAVKNLAGALEKLANTMSVLGKSNNDSAVNIVMNDTSKEYAE